MSSIEIDVHKYCKIIEDTETENWEEINKAVLGLISLITPLEGKNATEIIVQFNSTVFRLLKTAIAKVICDNRSQHTRDICFFLIKLSEVTKDHMKVLLRENFSSILDGIKVPNRVMNGYVHNAISIIISNTTFLSCIPKLLSEIKESKAKQVRERCLVSDVLICI